VASRNGRSEIDDEEKCLSLLGNRTEAVQVVSSLFTGSAIMADSLILCGYGGYGI
jgi:hypothetical protein